MSSEAVRILMTAREQLLPDVPGRTNAAYTLLTKFLEQAALAKIHVLETRDDTVTVALPHKPTVTIGVREGTIHVGIGENGKGPGPWIHPDLDYDVATKRYVGRAFDDTITPEPGKPRPRRDASAVLAELVVNVALGKV